MSRVIGLASAALVVWALLYAWQGDAQAAAPVPISDNCEQVATVGLLDVYYCDTFAGELYVNSFGFMMAVD